MSQESQLYEEAEAESKNNFFLIDNFFILLTF